MDYPTTLLPLPGDYRCELTVGDRLRTFRVHIPVGMQTVAAWPLIVAYHGSGTHAGTMEAFTGLNDLADEVGCVVVYPNGTGRSRTTLSWNVGRFNSFAAREGVDDIGFAHSLLDQLQDVLPIDPGQIFITGFSNGAMLAYCLADQMADRITAIAPVSGPMAQATCAPVRPVPICHFHGTEDEFAPLAGGIGKKSLTKTNFVSVQQTIQCWIQANQCVEHPLSDETLPMQQVDGTYITRRIYRGHSLSSEVILYLVHGGGHTWPGRESIFTILGTSTKNLHANPTLWAFFQRHKIK